MRSDKHYSVRQALRILRDRFPTLTETQLRYQIRAGRLVPDALVGRRQLFRLSTLREFSPAYVHPYGGRGGRKGVAPPGYLTVPEAASELGVEEARVYYLIREGRLVPEKRGQYVFRQRDVARMRAIVEPKRRGRNGS